MIQFAEVLKLLSDADISFIVVGGYAAMLHGAANVTQDLDICYERNAENMRRLARALVSVHASLRGAPPETRFLLDERSISQRMNFTFQTDIGDIDVLGELSGVGQFAELTKHAITMEIYGAKYRVASLGDLIRSKRAAGRPKDLSILPELEALEELKAAQQEANKKKR